MAHGARDKASAAPLSSDSPRRFAPVPLGALIPRAARPAFRRMPPGTAQLLTEWAALAGPEIARLATPTGFSRGTLTLACSGPAAMELTMLGPTLIARLNAGIGRPAVERLRFVQSPAAPRPVPMPKPVEHHAPPPVSEAIARVGSPELREALARLAEGLYRRDKDR